MGLRTVSLMTSFVALSLSSCAHKPPVDSFCQLYSPIVVNKGDGDIKALPPVKRRILGNELLYRSQCPRGGP